MPTESGHKRATEPGATEPGATESGGTESGGTESGGTESGGTEPGRAERGGAEPGRAERGGAEPGRAERGGAEPGRAESGGTEPGRAERGGAEPGRAERGRAEPGRAEPGRAESGGTEPGRAERGGAERGGAEPGATESGGAESGGAEHEPLAEFGRLVGDVGTGMPERGGERVDLLVRRPARTRTRAGVVTVGVVAMIAALSAVHLTQGTSSVDVFDVLKAVAGQGDPATQAVLEGSRIPRLLTALLVGLALGVAGAGMQSVARNPLASPDTLAVNAGAHLAVVAAAVAGLALPTVPAGAVAFLGGLAAAAAVLGMSGGGTASPRLVLVGSAIALTLHSATILLLLLFEQETTGLFAWGSGSLTVSDLVATQQMTPVVLVAVAALIAMGPSLDVLALGDDTATVFGLRVRRTRVGAVLLTVALTAAAVTVAGPVGFVGLCAPVITRLLAPRIGGHRITLPLSGLVGVALVLGADVALRAAMGSAEALRVPTGVVTTILGAAVLVWLARRGRSSGPAPAAPTGRVAVAGSRRRLVATGLVLTVLLVTTPLIGLMLGDRLVLLGDLANWLSGQTGPALTFVLDQRFARVCAALTAGAALAIAGCAVQSVSRNPLAEPGLLGITAGAGLGAVTLITAVPLAGAWHIAGAAGLGAALAFALVYGLAWRTGLDSDRLVIIGIATWSGGMAVITLLLVTSDPWNTAKALTWLSGSTYGRTLEQLIPIALALALLTPLLWSRHRELDLHALDNDTPRVLGLRVERSRLAILGAAGVLAATAVSAIGVVGFVGLVAPHLARSLVGGRHGRVLPVAAAVGAVLVSVADTLGRTVIAPAQVPAGLAIALIGTPYFVLVLWRTRSR